MMVELLMLLLQLRMRLNRRRRLLNEHRCFVDRFLLFLLIGFDFNRWSIGIGRNNWCAADRSHFCHGNCRAMMRWWRKMGWSIDDGFQ